VTRVRIATGEHFDADDVVIAGGIWGPQIAALVGEKLPLTPVAHPYVHGPRRASPPPKRLPIVRWREETAYARDHGDRYGIGTHDHTALAVNAASTNHAEQPWPEALFGQAIGAALRLMPSEYRFTVDQRLNGVFAMPADNLPFLGPSAGIAGLWIAVSIWVTHAGGAAGVLVDLMTGRTPSVEGLETLRPGRFAGQNDDELTARALKKYREIWMPMSSPRVALTHESVKTGV
jgi:glycine/D-amino acid oxidase-like deaminating enzyme